MTLTKTSWLLGFAFSDIGDRPISKITAQELLNVLRKIEARGNYETARRLRSTCGMVFRYAIATGRAERDPSVDLRGALTTPKVKHRATITEPKAIGALYCALLTGSMGSLQPMLLFVSLHFCLCGLVNYATPNGRSSI